MPTTMLQVDHAKLDGEKVLVSFKQTQKTDSKDVPVIPDAEGLPSGFPKAVNLSSVNEESGIAEIPRDGSIIVLATGVSARITLDDSK